MILKVVALVVFNLATLTAFLKVVATLRELLPQLQHGVRIEDLPRQLQLHLATLAMKLINLLLFQLLCTVDLWIKETSHSSFVESLALLNSVLVLEVDHQDLLVPHTFFVHFLGVREKFFFDVATLEASVIIVVIILVVLIFLVFILSFSLLSLQKATLLS